MLAMGIGPIGPFEAIIILLVVVLIFGVSRVGDLGGALGKSVREFRKASKEGDGDKAQISPSGEAKAGPEGRFCDNCGEQLSSDVKFCAKCGAPAQASVS